MKDNEINRSTIFFHSCPACGFELAYKNSETRILCPNCGETSDVDALKGMASSPLRPSSIKEDIPDYHGELDPISLQIYMKRYYKNELPGIAGVEIDLNPVRFLSPIRSLCLTKGRDKETYKTLFLAYELPITKKLESIEIAEADALESFNAGDMKRAEMLVECIRESIHELRLREKDLIAEMDGAALAFADCAGASAMEINELHNRIDEIHGKIEGKEEPMNILQIEDVRLSKEGIDDSIRTSLRESGLDAERIYNEANSLLSLGKNAEAIEKLSKLGNYKDSSILIKKAENCTLFNQELLYIGGKAYIVYDHDDAARDRRKGKDNGDLFSFLRGGERKFDLYPVKDGITDFGHPLLFNFRYLLSSYANHIFYIDEEGGLFDFDCLSGTNKEIRIEGSLRPDLFYETINDGKEGLLLIEGEGEALDASRNRFRLALIRFLSFSDPIVVYPYKIDSLLPVNGLEKPCRYPFVCFSSIEMKEDTSALKSKIDIVDHIGLLNLKEGEARFDFLRQNDKFITSNDEYVYFARVDGSQYNFDVIRKSFASGNEELVANNVYHAIALLGEDFFFTVGNHHKQVLYKVSVNTRDVTHIIDRFDGYALLHAGYFYFYRGSGLNRTLVRIKDSGGIVTPIALHVHPEEGGFAEFKGGYFYYVDAFDRLCRVCIDGEHYEVIASNVEEILRVDIDSIYFVIKETIDELYDDEMKKKGRKYRIGKSVYQYQMIEHTLEKILFGIEEARFFDDETILVYSISKKRFVSTNLPRKKETKIDRVVREYGFYNVYTKTYETIVVFGYPNMRYKKTPVIFKEVDLPRPFEDESSLIKIFYKGKK